MPVIHLLCYAPLQNANSKHLRGVWEKLEGRAVATVSTICPWDFHHSKVLFSFSSHHVSVTMQLCIIVIIGSFKRCMNIFVEMDLFVPP